MPQIDPYDVNIPGLESPASNALTITPSDTDDLPVKPRAIMVNVSGNMRMQLGENIVTLSLHGGTAYPVRPTRIYATDTTATGITVLW